MGAEHSDTQNVEEVLRPETVGHRWQELNPNCTKYAEEQWSTIRKQIASDPSDSGCRRRRREALEQKLEDYGCTKADRMQTMISQIPCGEFPEHMLSLVWPSSGQMHKQCRFDQRRIIEDPNVDKSKTNGSFMGMVVDKMSQFLDRDMADSKWNHGDDTGGDWMMYPEWHIDRKVIDNGKTIVAMILIGYRQPTSDTTVFVVVKQIRIIGQNANPLNSTDVVMYVAHPTDAPPRIQIPFQTIMQNVVNGFLKSKLAGPEQKFQTHTFFMKQMIEAVSIAKNEGRLQWFAKQEEAATDTLWQRWTQRQGIPNVRRLL